MDGDPNTNKKNSLTISNLLLNDSAVYFCAASLHSVSDHLQCPPQLLAPLVNMSKTGYKKICLLFILLVFNSKYSQKSYLFIEVKLLKEKKTVDIK